MGDALPYFQLWLQQHNAMTHSVVVPLYNKAAYVAETLASLAAQTKLPDELIIVDDASTDLSLATAKHFLETHAAKFESCDIRLIELKQNQGPGHARNTGLQHATGELISFLDADDLYHPHLLMVASEIFERQQADFLVLNIEFLPGGEVYPKMDGLKAYLQPAGNGLYKILTPLKAVSSPHFIMGVGSNVIVRRKWIGDTTYITGSLLNEGIDFWYRVLKSVPAKGTIGLLSGEYLKVREVPGSLSRRTYRHYKEIDIPPLITRYKSSKDVHDRLLMAMIGERWYRHAMQTLPSKRQKLLFALHYAYLIPAYLRCISLRLTTNQQKAT